MVRQERQMALQVCPRLAAMLPDRLLADPASAPPALEAAIIAAADRLLPEVNRNNGDTARWGWRKHGVRVIAMLAIALEDPGVEHPCRYFGRMVSYDPDSALDLRFNLDRILRQPRQAPPPAADPEWQAFEAELQHAAPGPDEPAPDEPYEPAPLMSAPGADDPRWQPIAAELRVKIKAGPYGSYFGRLGFHGIESGVLTLSTPSDFSADRLEGEFRQKIIDACLAAGEDVRDVVVVRRKRVSPESGPGAGGPAP
jgi:hypothetical protein